MGLCSIWQMHYNSKFRYAVYRFPVASSRRDDLMSVLYNMLYLKDGMLPWLKGVKDQQKKNQMKAFQDILRGKQ